jgi:hypothetical protein
MEGGPMAMFSRLWISGLVTALCLLTAGCSSLSDSHRRHLEMVYNAHDEMVDISSKLQDIQQVMLYAGRVNDSPIADMAFDVAIAIQGEPDDTEKAYATTITKDMLKKEMARANKLLKRKQHLISTIDSQKNAIARDISSIASLESRYNLISRSLAKVAIFAIFALFFFLLVNRWLH